MVYKFGRIRTGNTYVQMQYCGKWESVRVEYLEFQGTRALFCWNPLLRFFCPNSDILVVFIRTRIAWLHNNDSFLSIPF